MIKNLILILLSMFPIASFADAHKCVTPSGKTVITDSGCGGIGKSKGSYESERISIERQRQAQAVTDRNMAQIERINSEDRAYRESLRQQQESYARSEERSMDTARQQEIDNGIKRQREECKDMASRATSRSQRAALSEICAKQEPDSNKFNNCKDQIARASSPSQRALIASTCTGDPDAGKRVREASSPTPQASAQTPPVVTSCDSAGCWDNHGNRYNNGGGTTKFRSDGKICNQVGSNLICN